MSHTLVVRVLPVIIGYLLGCVLPGYFLPLWIKHIDIRTVGDGNPGTINVRKEIGPALATVVLSYDLTKGLLSMLIA
ncbi:glycerol-3-phosphate acyltransferase, partial [bacterium]|nr:glycerol-3-phosphate acyltransferase [bacterium]